MNSTSNTYTYFNTFPTRLFYKCIQFHIPSISLDKSCLKALSRFLRIIRIQRINIFSMGQRFVLGKCLDIGRKKFVFVDIIANYGSNRHKSCHYGK